MLSRSARLTSALRSYQPRSYATSKTPVRIAVTGAAGAIGYSMLFRLASGELLGKEQPVILQCLEIEPGMKALEGVEMELRDCAFPLVKDIICTSDPNEAFEGTQFAFLVGAKPRGPGMERGDLIQANGGIFGPQGKALNDNADRDNLRVVVVGNPANTNALIASASAPDIDPRRFSAMTRLDHNRGVAELSRKLQCGVTDIENFAIWGNHSATQFPDIAETTIAGKAASSLVDNDWYVNDFIPTVQQRGAAIIKARGASSAASAASSAIDHMRDWALGTDGKQTSMAVWTGNESSGPYDTAQDIYYSFPVVCEGGDYHIVEGLSINDFQRDRMSATNLELLSEKEAVADLVKRS